MSRFMILWRGYIFPAWRPALRKCGGDVHTVQEWASYQRALRRGTPYRPVY